MKIVDFKIGSMYIPLKKPFKTSLRTVKNLKNVVIKIITDTGNAGYGEAAPTAVITGDSLGSIEYAIEKYIMPCIIGMNIENIEGIMLNLDRCIVKNSSAKAAVDIAVYDLFGQLYNTPLYKLLGGYRDKITTDVTVSIDTPDKMASDSIDAVKRGYKILKIKVGNGIDMDIERIKAVRSAVGNDIVLRMDANQGWNPKEAVNIIRKIEEMNIDVEFVEQPVSCRDMEGLKYVTDNVLIPILADESMFSSEDAAKIIENRAADLLNIKLMKTGGIHSALKICSIAETFGVQCMIGCMLESKLSVTAAVHLAGAKSIITKVDLDGPILPKTDPIKGGVVFDKSIISIPGTSGLGFESIDNIVWNN
ncbi:dipeptide epimerase [Clostridium tyrobutyricum]|uniref:dipeptide epimerase n=1 Tax=Clostridium tyrobutyricum TaxID=1519 RepID=UPI00057DBEDA|nr:dipeptide epimerase [Clostridium tyrobutyricum]MBV4425238.1 dipeptide epimerase [Clostridium tyrobutyricum]MBV4438810.1 dipeptide epimerase [Clostridium tyrobutyricum]MBV4448932.1 dipeptide epimerase [Clostridium tyrobutyricum]